MIKRRVRDLAIFGGPPAFRDKFYVGRPEICDRDQLRARIEDILDRRWLTNNGPRVQELEAKIAGLVGVKHCIAMCNGNIALQIAIRALGLTSEVIIPSMTFIATAHALEWQGISPVFCDIDPKTHNIDPRRVEEAITPRTSGIIGVHLWGRPCDIDGLAEIARRHHLRLLFDAAHAFACSYGGRMIGGFGDAEVFSFHATKFVSTLEGGAVVTEDDELAAKVRLMRNCGLADEDDVVCVGTNGKMNEVAAAVGLGSLERLDELIAEGRRNYWEYQRELAGVPGIHLVSYDEAERNNYQYVVLEIDQTVTGLTRDQVMEILRAENVMARRYFYPGCHRCEPYRSQRPDAAERLPETEGLVRRVLCLPSGTAVDRETIRETCGLIQLGVAHGDEIRDRLRR